ncbi:hypothetical protein AB205_0003340 [Aquarana catesbeiana]|uniref:Uncharacterized protein n=1 Tax=Aquarana catesbeiana TaxID=8400 RepID=A0A2G9RV74_AQUCT|nr:hypothetical protein AB205_0003340 [Aquarana catesbeiana]
MPCCYVVAPNLPLPGLWRSASLPPSPVLLENVRVRVQSSRFHADNIRLDIISNKPHISQEELPSNTPGSNLGRTELVREVTRTAIEAQLAKEEEAAEKQFGLQNREYRQTRGRSLYTLLEEVRDLALLSLSEE